MSHETRQPRPNPSVPELWGRFVADFAEHATDAHSQATEARLARSAFSAIEQGNAAAFSTAIDVLQTKLRGGKARMFRPFGSYLKAIQHERPAVLERHALYDSSLGQLSEILASYGSLSKPKAQRARGRVNELTASALIARRNSPKVTLVPSLHIQDASSEPSLNHDFLFIDRSADEPYAQAVQIKHDASRADNYDPGIAIITASEDLHVCIYDKSAPCHGHDCVLQKTARYLLTESARTPGITSALDTLTNGLLIKLSTWGEYQQAWTEATEYNRQVILRTRKRARDAARPNFIPDPRAESGPGFGELAS